MNQQTPLAFNDAAYVNTVFVNPWHPMSNSVDLKTLGKLLEELGECVSASARCLIQGIDENEPVTRKANRLWLMEELADVKANMKKVIERFELEEGFIDTRARLKGSALDAWHAMA